MGSSASSSGAPMPPFGGGGLGAFGAGSKASFSTPSTKATDAGEVTKGNPSSGSAVQAPPFGASGLGAFGAANALSGSAGTSQAKSAAGGLFSAKAGSASAAASPFGAGGLAAFGTSKVSSGAGAKTTSAAASSSARPSPALAKVRSIFAGEGLGNAASDGVLSKLVSDEKGHEADVVIIVAWYKQYQPEKLREVEKLGKILKKTRDADRNTLWEKLHKKYGPLDTSDLDAFAESVSPKWRKRAQGKASSADAAAFATAQNEAINKVAEFLQRASRPGAAQSLDDVTVALKEIQAATAAAPSAGGSGGDLGDQLTATIAEMFQDLVGLQQRVVMLQSNKLTSAETGKRCERLSRTCAKAVEDIAEVDEGLRRSEVISCFLKAEIVEIQQQKDAIRSMLSASSRSKRRSKQDEAGLDASAQQQKDDIEAKVTDAKEGLYRLKREIDFQRHLLENKAQLRTLKRCSTNPSRIIIDRLKENYQRTKEKAYRANKAMERVKELLDQYKRIETSAARPHAAQRTAAYTSRNQVARRDAHVDPSPVAVIDRDLKEHSEDNVAVRAKALRHTLQFSRNSVEPRQLDLGPDPLVANDALAIASAPHSVMVASSEAVNATVDELSLLATPAGGATAAPRLGISPARSSAVGAIFGGAGGSGSSSTPGERTVTTERLLSQAKTQSDTPSLNIKGRSAQSEDEQAVVENVIKSLSDLEKTSKLGKKLAEASGFAVEGPGPMRPSPQPLKLPEQKAPQRVSGAQPLAKAAAKAAGSAPPPPLSSFKASAELSAEPQAAAPAKASGAKLGLGAASTSPFKATADAPEPAADAKQPASGGLMGSLSGAKPGGTSTLSNAFAKAGGQSSTAPLGGGGLAASLPSAGQKGLSFQGSSSKGAFAAGEQSSSFTGLQGSNAGNTSSSASPFGRSSSSMTMSTSTTGLGGLASSTTQGLGSGLLGSGGNSSASPFGAGNSTASSGGMSMGASSTPMGLSMGGGMSSMGASASFDMKTWLMDFYNRYNRDKLGKVEKLAHDYKGRYEKLINALKKTYANVADPSIWPTAAQLQAAQGTAAPAPPQQGLNSGLPSAGRRGLNLGSSGGAFAAAQGGTFQGLQAGGSSTSPFSNGASSMSMSNRSGGLGGMGGNSSASPFGGGASASPFGTPGNSGMSAGGGGLGGMSLGQSSMGLGQGAMGQGGLGQGGLGQSGMRQTSGSQGMGLAGGNAFGQQQPSFGGGSMLGAGHSTGQMKAVQPGLGFAAFAGKGLLR